MDASAALGGIDNRHRANAARIGADDETVEALANPSPDDLHAVLLQLRDQGVLLLFVHLLDADDVHTDHRVLSVSPAKQQ